MQKGEVSTYSGGTAIAITFSSYDFSEPIPIKRWVPPRVPGLYAVLIPDPAARPRPFKVIYFGQSGDLSETEFFRGHIKYSTWMKWAGSEENLHIAICLMPTHSETERLTAEAALISRYLPECNR